MVKSFLSLSIGASSLIIPLFYKEIEAWTILKRLVLAISLIVVLLTVAYFIHTYAIWIRRVQKISSKLAYFLYILIFHRYARLGYFTAIMGVIIFKTWYNPIVAALCIVSFIIFFASIKQFPLQIYREIIFEDDFINNNNGWEKNYWGTTNPEKTTRFEDSMIIFEATESELFNAGKEYGAYIDLKNGIEEGVTYEVYCRAKSDPGTTMKFQLWIHDNVIGNNSSMRTAKCPDPAETPSEEFKEIRVKFVATVTRGMRIHLHNYGGQGKIYIDKVTVVKVKG